MESKGPLTKDQEMSLSIRVAEAILKLKKKEETDTEFAKRIGQSPQTISNYRNGANGASLEVLREVCIRTGAEPAALLGITETEKGIFDIRTLDKTEEHIQKLLAQMRTFGRPAAKPKSKPRAKPKSKESARAADKRQIAEHHDATDRKAQREVREGGAGPPRNDRRKVPKTVLDNLG